MLTSRRTLLVWGALVALVIVGGWRLFANNSSFYVPLAARPDLEPHISKNISGVTEIVSMPAASASSSGLPTQNTSPRSIRKDFINAKDYAKFTREIRTEAVAGNAEAQYFMSAALGYCNSFYKAFVIHGKLLTRSEMQSRYVIATPASRESIDEAYDRCHALMGDSSSEISEWSEWLDKSARQHYPLAEVAAVAEMRNQSLRAQPETSTPQSLEDIGSPSSLALHALKSGDPEVYFRLADFAVETQGDNYGINSVAWRLLACNRGYDCSAQAPWVKLSCADNPVCFPGITGNKFIELANAKDMAAITSKATEIGQVIDAKDWARVTSYLQFEQDSETEKGSQ